VSKWKSLKWKNGKVSGKFSCDVYLIVRKLILSGVGVLALGGLLFFATDVRPQDVVLNDLRFAALPATAKAPPGNPATKDKVTLGRALFWDPILSGRKDVACATCHHPRFGYAENRDLSIGVDGIGLGASRHFKPATTIPFVKRNSQTILNTAFNGMTDGGAYDPSTAPMFWDLRANSLEAQALEPIKTLEEMRSDTYTEANAIPTVVARLNAVADYRDLFARAFGGVRPITGDQLGQALATFQRSLTASNAPFDRYMRGAADAMSAAQLRGMRRFQRVGCINCHRGPMFSDYQVHVLGVPDNPLLRVSDGGVDRSYAFRTASLRNLTHTAPYMHNGVFDSLRDVLEFYDDVSGRRGRARNVHVSREQLDPLLRQLRDPDDRAGDLIAFLEALTDDSFDRTVPARVPSGLKPGGNIQ
jgi:cytochrome c peroxidase